MASEGYYDILGLKKQSTQEEIRKAFRRLSLIHHPDRNGGSDDSEFQKINEAYETLSDPQKRRIYDLTSQNPFMRIAQCFICFIYFLKFSKASCNKKKH